MKLEILTFTIFVLLISRALIAVDYKKDYQYLSPIPDAQYVSPSATIIVHFENYSPFDLVNLSTCIRVKGKQSGYHSGQTTIAADKKTAIFKPAINFSPGETVFVTITPEFSTTNPAKIEPLQYHFDVSQNEIRPQNQGMDESLRKSSFNRTESLQQPNVGQAMIMDNGVSVPSDFPHIKITVNSNPAALLDTSKLTLKKLTELTNNKQYYFRVTAIDKNGTESGYSNEEGAMINFIEPGQNSVRNGDHAINFDASRLATGIYFCKFEAWTLNNSKPYSAVQKLQLIK